MSEKNISAKNAIATSLDSSEHVQCQIFICPKCVCMSVCIHTETHRHTHIIMQLSKENIFAHIYHSL